MYACEDRQLIYIPVPTTGSESFTDALKCKWHGHEGHQTAWDAMRYNTAWKHYAHFKKIGFIRHPLPWLNSFFGWSMRGSQWSDYITGLPYDKDKGGDQFLYHLTMTPLDWLTHPTTGELLVDEVYRTEDLERVARTMNITIKRLNKTTPGRFKKTLDWHDHRLDYIERRFHRELKYYEQGLRYEKCDLRTTI